MSRMLAASLRRAEPWRHWYRRALPAYVVFLVICTHLPRLQLAGAQSDKKAHLVAFALLAFLFWRFCETFRAPGASFWVWAWLALVSFAAVDEYTQQFVGRSTDVNDWYMDMLGITLMLAALELLRRLRPAAPPPG